MKKVILALVVIATALCGCSKDIPTGPHTGHGGEYPILFGYSDTRAVADLDTLEAEGFKVYAYFTGYADDPQGRYGTFEKYVEHTTQNVWAYEGLEYWIPGVSYWFTAFYPHDLSGLQIQNNTKDQSYTISGFDITEQVDVMVAKKATSVPANAVAPSDGSKVSLNFEHLLSCVVVELHTSMSDVTVTKVSLLNITDGESCTNGAWTANSHLTASLFYDEDTQVTNTNTDVTGGGFLVIPGKCDVTLKIETTQKDYEVKLSVDWAKGKKYTYTAEIKQNNIIFDDLPHVDVWDSESATGSVIIK